MKLTAYTDGSYNSNGHVYGGGVVILLEGIQQPLTQKVCGNDNNYARFRNVAGEILAVMAAVEVAKKADCEELDIYYDYEGLEKWVSGAWRANKTVSIQYRNYVLEAMRNMAIRFHKVSAHTGDEYNELADKLAREATRGA